MVWIRTARSSGNSIGFIKLYDGTIGLDVQVVIDDQTDLGQDDIKTITTGTTGACLFIEGKVVPSLGKEQAVEIQAIKVKVVGTTDSSSFPLVKGKMSLPYLRDIAHMRPRSRIIQAATRVRNCLAYATHTFFQQQGYQYIHTPLITASDCEGAGEMFQVTTILDSNGKLKHTTKEGNADFEKDFLKKAFLTVSGQLNAEIYATAMSSVYTFGPTFRAENSNTSRHLAEFWMIEPEIAFCDLEEDMRIAEAYIKFTIRAALEQCNHDIDYLQTFEKEEIKNREKMAIEAARKAKIEAKNKKKNSNQNHTEDTKISSNTSKKSPAPQQSQPQPQQEEEGKETTTTQKSS